MNEDIFNHLIEVEGEAANLLFEAQVEADDKISTVKKEAAEEYKKESDEIREVLDAKFEEEKKRVDATAQKELDDYLKDLQARHVDYDSFNRMIDEYFFGEQRCVGKNEQPK